MNRRSFLITTGSLLCEQALIGCSAQTHQTLAVRFLQSSVPAQVLKAFEKSLQQDKPVNLRFAPAPQLVSIFDQLQHWQQPSQSQPGFSLPFGLLGNKSPQIANLVTTGDYWLTAAIQQGLIRPLDIQQLPLWSRLPTRWQNLVRRNSQGLLDPQGAIWGAPYRWGTTVIAYRQDKFKALGWQPTDWSDLWRPELQGLISLLDQPREVIGLTLKKLGHSYNIPNLQKVSALVSQLQALHRQAKVYSSTDYLQPLLLGDTWLAVGWSADILATMQRNPEIAAVIPRSGTALWADVWVQPQSAPAQDSVLAHRWMDFCWQGAIAPQFSLLGQATSPVLEAQNVKDLPPELRSKPLLFPESSILERSEFLEPLSEATMTQYQTLWQQIRNVV
jgi:putative spermidine/putrescine transport system substrate-binding protein